MNWSNSYILVLLFFFFSCKEREEKVVSDIGIVPTETYKSTAHIIEAESLLASLDEPGLKIIDFRKEEAYLKGHIPNALRMYRTDIEDHSYPYKGMMASKETIEALFSKLGISPSDTLVVYDDHGGSDASRLWWVLQNYNHTKVKLLNGGLRAWKAINGILDSKQNIIQSTNFTLPKESGMPFLIDREKLRQLMSEEKKPLILDVRTKDEHSGKRQKSGAMRAGRIPHSELIDWSRAIDYHETHKFRSYDELETLYGKLGASKENMIITYCHTGVRSAHTTFVLSELLGYTNIKNYDGSWSEWSYYEDLPLEKDSTTTILQ